MYYNYGILQVRISDDHDYPIVGMPAGGLLYQHSLLPVSVTSSVNIAMVI